jgi:DNA-binding transcriptional regulator GbsR (MarR family)
VKSPDSIATTPIPEKNPPVQTPHKHRTSIAFETIERYTVSELIAKLGVKRQAIETTKSFYRFDDLSKVPVAAQLERLWLSYVSAYDNQYMRLAEIQNELSKTHGIRKDIDEVANTLKKYRNRP